MQCNSVSSNCWRCRRTSMTGSLRDFQKPIFIRAKREQYNPWHQEKRPAGRSPGIELAVIDHCPHIEKPRRGGGIDLEVASAEDLCLGEIGPLISRVGKILEDERSNQNGGDPSGEHEEHYD